MNIDLKRSFQIGIGALLILRLTWFFAPWAFAYPDGTQAALAWLGVNSAINIDMIVALSSIFLLLHLISYIGIILFYRWARFSLLMICILGGMAIPLYGISVQSGYEGMLGYFLVLGDGFILALSYFSGVRTRFR